MHVLSFHLSDVWPGSSCICGFEKLLEEYFPLKPGSISSECRASAVFILGFVFVVSPHITSIMAHVTFLPRPSLGLQQAYNKMVI